MGTRNKSITMEELELYLNRINMERAPDRQLAIVKLPTDYGTKYIIRRLTKYQESFIDVFCGSKREAFMFLKGYSEAIKMYSKLTDAAASVYEAYQDRIKADCDSARYTALSNLFSAIINLKPTLRECGESVRVYDYF